MVCNDISFLLEMGLGVQVDKPDPIIQKTGKIYIKIIIKKNKISFYIENNILFKKVGKK